MELRLRGRPYLRWKAYSNDDSSWTSSLGSAWRSTLPRGSPARTFSSGSSDLFVCKGVPDHIRSDNGSEFTAKSVREWLGRVGVKTLFIEPLLTVGEWLHRELLLYCFETSCSNGKRLTRCSRPRCSSNGGGSTTTQSVHTVPWAIAPRRQRRGSPVRSHGVRLSKRTGLVYWRAKS